MLDNHNMEKENAKANNVKRKIQVYSKSTISMRNVVQIGDEGCCKERMEGGRDPSRCTRHYDCWFARCTSIFRRHPM